MQMIDIQTIDWNEVWKARKRRRSYSVRNAESWNKRAPSFAEHTAKSGYAEAFLKIVNPKKSWTVFDMACGAGTLAIPFAKHVKAITAVDFSERMLEILQARCEKLNISTIRTINRSWEDDWKKAGIGVHDVAIASRSLVVDDLRSAIMKLDSFARKRVYISTIVGDGPHDRRIYEAVDRDLNVGLDYIYYYNLLYQMGIHARIDFITEKNRANYRNPHDAFLSQKWMFDNMTPVEERKLKNYLDSRLVFREGRWTLDYERTIEWAVIWWNKA